MDTAILAPAAALAIWTMVMLLWMAATRLPALAKMKIDKETSRGSRGQDLEGKLPAQLQWKAHNYMHLVEQPTIFYPIIIILALVGFTPFDLMLAWAYVGLRVVHSIWQAVVNTIPVRLSLFLLSTIIMIILAVRAFVSVI